MSLERVHCWLCCCRYPLVKAKAVGVRNEGDYAGEDRIQLGRVQTLLETVERPPRLLNTGYESLKFAPAVSKFQLQNLNDHENQNLVKIKTI